VRIRICLIVKLSNLTQSILTQTVWKIYILSFTENGYRIFARKKWSNCVVQLQLRTKNPNNSRPYLGQPILLQPHQILKLTTKMGKRLTSTWMTSFFVITKSNCSTILLFLFSASGKTKFKNWQILQKKRHN